MTNTPTDTSQSHKGASLVPNRLSDRRNAVATELILRPEPREQECMWRPNCTGAEDHFSPRRDSSQRVAGGGINVLDASGTRMRRCTPSTLLAFLKEDALAVCSNANVDLAVVDQRLEEGSI